MPAVSITPTLKRRGFHRLKDFCEDMLKKYGNGVRFSFARKKHARK